MKPQIITAMEVTKLTCYLPRDDAFSFNPKRPAKWLQRVCLAILRRLGCYDMEAIQRYERHVIDGDTFMDRALKQHEWMARVLEREPKTILLGPDEYNELMARADETNFAFEFDTRYGKDGHFYGMQVRVIPWMSGFLVM